MKYSFINKTVMTTELKQADFIIEVFEANGYQLTNNWRYVFDFENHSKWIFHFDDINKTFNLEGSHWKEEREEPKENSHWWSTWYSSCWKKLVLADLIDPDEIELVW